MCQVDLFAFKYSQFLGVLDMLLPKNFLLSPNRGFSLVETLVASAILSGAVLAYMATTTLTQKGLNHTAETYKVLEIKKSIDNYLSDRARCYAIFNPHANWAILNAGGLSLTQLDAGQKATLDTIYSDRRFQIKDLTIEPLNLDANTLTLLPDDGAHKATAKVKITIEAKISQNKTYRNNEIQLSKDAEPFPYIFHINKNGTLRDCYSRSSQTVAAQLSLCNNLGGILEVDKCVFPLYSGTIDLVTQRPTDVALPKLELSQLLCELDKKSVLSSNHGINAINDPDDGSILVPAIEQSVAVTKYCKLPVGRGIGGGVDTLLLPQP